MFVVTISRQMGSLGDQVAVDLSRKLGWELIDRSQLLHRFFYDISDTRARHLLNESAKFYKTASLTGQDYIDVLRDRLYGLADIQPAVLLGFGSQVLFASRKDALNIRIVSSGKSRALRVKRQYRVSQEQAEKILATADRKHKRFVSTVFDVDLTDPFLYHMTLNTDDLSTDECVCAIVAAYEERQKRLQIERESLETAAIDHQAEAPILKNPAEIEFAKILDMYQIDWTYEPKTFPVEWDAEGNVTLAFSPDFYLPKFDTYLELTTMNQKYVTRKNKKLKKVRELYPGINIKIVYKKDFHSLIERIYPSEPKETKDEDRV